MNVGAARATARQWVAAEASGAPGFGGALFHGSTATLADDAILPVGSDVDLLIVADPVPPLPPGKRRAGDVVLDVAFLDWDDLGPAERILGQHHLAGSFRARGVIADLTGRLTELHAAVARDFARRRWVERRRDDASDKALRFLQSIDDAASWPEQVTAWLFAAGAATHVLLVAGLRNPTVRRRYLAARELLADFGLHDAYKPLLDLLGCRAMTREQAEMHLAALADAFDLAKAVVATPFFFASDISDLARPIAIDASRAMIAAGDHREAVFWLVATWSRCQQILRRDAPPDLRHACDPGYRALLADLGIAGPGDLRRRGEQVAAALPWVSGVADTIIAANPDVTD